MSRPSSSLRAPDRAVLGAILCVWLAVGSAAESSFASVSAQPPEAAPAPAAAAAPASAQEPEFGPPDGKWLKEEDGREYFIWEVPRAEGHYVFVDDKTVLLRGGLTLKPERIDEKTFYVRVYRVRPEDQPPVTRPKPTPEELAKAAKNYEVALPTVERLVFAPFDTGLPKSGQTRHGFAAADFNGDRLLDLALPPQRKAGGGPRIFLGDGKGGWRQWEGVSTPAGMRMDYGDIAAADFNRDGHADLALGMHLLGITVLVGDGKGSFRAWNRGLDYEEPEGETAGDIFSSRAIEVLDWNGDGWPDLVCLGEGLRLNLSQVGPKVGGTSSYGVVVYLNGRDGSWRRVDRGTDSTQIFGDWLAVANLSGRARRDVVTSVSALNRKDIVHLRDGDLWKSVAVEAVRPRGYVTSVAAADFDGDGLDDLAVAWSNGELGVRRTGVDVLLTRRTKEGTNWSRTGLALSMGTSPYFVAAGDVDADGAADVVSFQDDGQPAVYLGDGRGSFRLHKGPQLGPAWAGCRAYGLGILDLDGDGRAEIVAALAGEEANAMQKLLAPAAATCASQGGLWVWKVTASPL